MRANVTAPDAIVAYPAIMLLAAGMVLGGGGSPAPLLELMLQGLAALLIGWWLMRDRAGLSRVPADVWWIAALITTLHLLQLIPLPPGMWQSLPGRVTERMALALVDADQTWRPITISPSRTLASLLAALTALATLAMISTLGIASRWRLIAVAAAGGLITIILGAAQLAGGSGNPARLFDPESPYLTGFQANHNSTADMILIAMLACAALGRAGLNHGWARPSLPQGVLVAGTVDAILLLGLFFTGSRAGMALALPVLVFQFIILHSDARIRWGQMGLVAGLGLASLGVAALLLRSNRAIEPILARLTLEGEFRPELWRDTLYAIGQYWPFGSGMGTFTQVVIAAERLEVVDPTLPNRAHNELLETALTGGLPGLIVLAGVAGLLIRGFMCARHCADRDFRLQRLFALGVLLVIGLHSLVDYPLRSMALAGFAAMAAALLFPAREAAPGKSGESRL